MIDRIALFILGLLILVSLLFYSCAYNQIMLNDTHGTATDVGDETSTPTENTTANPNISIPVPIGAPK